LNYTYIFDGGELECELEYNEECRGSYEDGLQMEPHEPEYCVLEKAKLNGGVDIYELLSQYIVELIETKALDKTEDI